MKKRIFSLLLTLCLVVGLLPTVAYAEGQYSDTNGHWAESSVERWSNYGIVSGYNGKFSPNDNLTRAQMAVILANILGLTEDPEDCPFDDVKDSDWFAPYVKKCYAAGIMLGNNGKANPNAPITRQEAIVMLCRTLNMKPIDSNDLSVFVDGESVAEYAAPYIAAMVKAGVIKGDDTGRVLPTGMLTRGAIMAILDRSVVQYINEPGTYELVGEDGIILVASNGVTLTGKTNADLVISAGASGGKITFEKATITGSMTIQADNTTVDSKNSTLPKAEILGEGSKVSNITSSSGSGGSSSSGGNTIPTISDLVVTESGTYSNATYRNVTIAESVGDGHVEFDNVTITGNIVVNGGGSNTFVLKNCSISNTSQVVVGKVGGEPPRIELTNTPIPNIDIRKPAIIESTDSNSAIQNVVAHDNLEVRGADTVIETITAMKNSDTGMEFNVLAGKIINLISNTKLLIQGVAGTVDTVTISEDAKINSQIVNKLIVKEDAVSNLKVEFIDTPNGPIPLKIDVCINSNNGVEITADTEDLGNIALSTDLNETPSDVFLNTMPIGHIHDWDKGVVTKEPTCTEKGIKTYTCSVSNCTYDSATKTEDIPALGHSWNEGTVTKEPTCTSTGIKTYTCTRNGCNGTKTEDIPALGHTSEVIPAKAATCTEKGLTEGSKCSVCQEILVAQEATDHLGHNWESVTTPATCTTAGKIEKSCTRCDATDEEIIPASHTLTWVEAKEATCTEAGNNEYSTCSVCHKVFKDTADGLTETTVEAETIPSLGHDYSYNYKDSSVHTYDCSRCDVHGEEEHSFVSDDSASNVVCTKCEYNATVEQ